MICDGCRAASHDGCPGKGNCDCQHRPSKMCGAVDAEHGDGLCGLPARLYACGWRCSGHRP